MKRPALFIALGFILGIWIRLSADTWLLFATSFCAVLISFIFRRHMHWAWLLLVLAALVGGYVRTDGMEQRPQRLQSLITASDEETSKTETSKTETSSNDAVKEPAFLQASSKDYIEGHLLVTGVKAGEYSTTITGRLKKIHSLKNAYISNIGVVLYSDEQPACQIGDLISFQAKLKRVEANKNPGGFNQLRYFAARKIYFTGSLKYYEVAQTGANRWLAGMERLNVQLEKQLKNIYLGDAGDIMTMMLFGSSEAIDPQIKQFYQIGGISHILAISGMHVTLFGVLLYKLLGFIIKKPRAVILLSCLILWFYCLLSGAGISSLRATLMFSVALSAKFYGEKYDLFAALYISALIILILNPYQLYDIGFQLSYLAVLGIALIYPILNARYNCGKNPLLELLLVTVSASLATNTVLLQNFFALPLYSLPVNMLAVPASGLLLGFGILSLGLSWIHIAIGRFFGAIVYFILQFIELCCQVVLKLPCNMILLGRQPGFIVLGYILLVLLFLYYKQMKIKPVFLMYPALIIIMAALLLPYWKGRQLEVDFLAVGQGDSTVIRYDGKCFLVDGGGELNKKSDKNMGTYVVLPYLRSKGIGKLNGVFISHSDFDHIYGIIEVMQQMEVGFIALPAAYRQYHDELTLTLLDLAAQKEIPVCYFDEKDEYRHKDLLIQCLYGGDSSDKVDVNNDRSMVMRVAFKEMDILLAGDIEAEGEKRILEAGKSFPTEIIKIPHHGSQTSSTAHFIEGFSPQTGILSYGVPNRFGHPNADVVKRYDAAGVMLYHTPSDGAIQITSDGNSYKIQTYYSKKEVIQRCKP